MKWYEDYDLILSLFENANVWVDETKFYFRDDPEEDEHFLGYLPQYEEPYWVGYCDIPDGTEFKTAKEMFEAKIYDGQSIKERWENVVLVTLGGINVDEWDEKHLRPDAD